MPVTKQTRGDGSGNPNPVEQLIAALDHRRLVPRQEIILSLRAALEDRRLLSEYIARLTPDLVGDMPPELPDAALTALMMQGPDALADDQIQTLLRDPATLLAAQDIIFAFWPGNWMPVREPTAQIVKAVADRLRRRLGFE